MPKNTVVEIDKDFNKIIKPLEGNTNVNIYGDKKYAQDKLDKRKIEIELEIKNYNKRIEDYKEKLKLEVLRESESES